jgi:tripartite-type tricarboxylate transporter receptor subunit TctC
VIEQVVYVVAPKGLPEEARTRLTDRIRSALQDSRYNDYTVRNGNLVREVTGDAFERELLQMEKSFAVVMKQVWKAT